MERKQGRQAPKKAKGKAKGKNRGKRPKPVADPAPLFQAAVADFQAGRLEEADAALARITLGHPGIPDVLQLRGMIALETGKPDEAAEIFRDGLAADPDAAGFCDLLGTALSQSGRLEEAETAYRRALNLSPGDAGVFNNLGNVLKKLERPEEARDAYSESLRLRPSHANTELNLGNILEDMAAYEDSEAAYRRAMGLVPDDPVAPSSLGRVLLAQGRLEESEAAVTRALEIDPGHADAHELLGILLFLKGQLGDAWKAYDWRWRDEAEKRETSLPAWSGQPLEGKTVLVWGEQGVGDEIFFDSMVPDLIAAGATVRLECDRRLVPLIERSFPGIECLVRGDAAGFEGAHDGADYQVASGCLGRWLRPDFDSFPARPAYLVADGARVDALRARYLEGGGDLLVGIAWRSVNPRIGQNKSMPLTALAPLAAVPGIRLIDLQYGDTAAERRAFEKETGEAILRDEEIDQMADLDAFAAQVAALDLAVSVSNTTVHFGGALGVPTWVMLSAVPLWRWMMDRDDSPWYPSVRLFRQTRAGEWADVIRRVSDALQDFSAP